MEGGFIPIAGECPNRGTFCPQMELFSFSCRWIWCSTGGIHGPGQQSLIHPKTEAQSPPYREGLREARRVQERSREPRMGHGQFRGSRRQEEWQRTRQERQSRGITPWRPQDDQGPSRTQRRRGNGRQEAQKKIED